MLTNMFWRRASLASACVLAACGGSGGDSGQQPQASATGSSTVSLPTPTPSPTPTPTPTSSTASTDADVILVMGQSNATGYQADRSIDYVPDQAILAWTGSNLTPYAPNDFTGIEAQAPAGYWAAELSYARYYRAAYPGRTLVILRYTAAGSPLATSAGADWSTQSSGELLDGARAFTRTAFAALRARGMTPHLRLLWWQQGENDALGGLGSAYSANLTALIAAFRDPAGDFAVPATAPIVIGRLCSSVVALYGTSAAQVRAAQTSIAHADVGGPQVLMNDDDLPLESDIHLSKADQLTVGYRLWQIDQGSYPEP